MNNLQFNETEMFENEESQFKSTGKKPDYYLGCFDTPELVEQAKRVIRSTARSFYDRNPFLFQNKGYTPEDLENEIHLKLLHKFVEQENPFWVSTLGNLKTISSFTLSKLIRNLTQKNQPKTTSLSTYLQNAEDDDAETELGGIIFKDETDLEEEVLNPIFLSDILSYIENLPENSDKYSKIFKYNLYLTQGIIVNLTNKEITGLDKIKLQGKGTLRTAVALVEGMDKKSKQLRKIEREYLSKMRDILQNEEYGININVDNYLEDQEDQKLILKGGSLKDKSQEDVNRIVRKGGILNKEKESELIGHKELAKKLTKIENKKKSGIKYKILNGRITKIPKPLTPQEQRQQAKLEYKQRQEDSKFDIKEEYELAVIEA